MAILKIFAADGAKGDKRFYIALIDNGKELLKSEEPTTDFAADNNAKTLNIKGPTGEWEEKETPFGKAFVFKPITDTYFTVSVELSLVLNVLGKAKIEWEPKELNPAYDPSKKEPNKNKGLSGS